MLLAQQLTIGGNISTMQTQIEKTRMRTEMVRNGRKVSVIFDSAEGVLRTLDDDSKSYTEVTKADIDRLSAQMATAMAQMQQQMQNLPPEQRARVEGMMAGRGAIVGALPEYKKVGTDRVGQWTCDKYEGSRNAERVSEVCTVEPSALGFTTADFAVIKQMADFFSKMMPPGMEGLFRMDSVGPNGFSGIPVRVVTYRSGAIQTTSEVTGVTRQNFDNSIFAVPAGYQKREMPGRGRGRQ